ncbi:MAG TPA: RDD family protein [Acidimicrobiales bacterium]|nr:RDD family protein [Acidimicrobiales bacterium]
MAAPIVTPEAVVLEFETAGLGSRLLAGTIDLSVQAAALFAVLVSAGAVASSGLDLGGAGAALAYFAVFCVLFVYPAAFETFWRGRTPGKAALGLRVVTVEGAPISFRHAAIRAIFALVDWYATQGVVGIAALLVTRRNQRVGDLVAGTIVLRERNAAQAPAPVQFHTPPGLEAFVASLSTGALGPGDYEPVRAFLLRAPTLPPHVRSELANRLAHPLVARLRVIVPAGVPPEAFLVCVAAAYQRRTAAVGRRASSGFTSVWARTPSSRSWVPEAALEPSPTGDSGAGGGGFAVPG